jgi:hypothetical protein
LIVALLGVEVDRLLELDLVLGDHDHRVLLRAPVGGLGRLGRALVDDLRALGHAVAVVVAVGAAVVVGEAVLVLGLVGALIDGDR